MAVSFVSPLFWQIEFIVQNGLASKKEVKTSVAELDKLVELYGHDARVFLVRSLFAVIDFRKEHHSHQQHQVNLLSQTMIQLSTQPNFGTILCLALTGDGTVNSNGQPGKQGPIDQSFIGSLCRVLKLPVPQRIIIGVALASWEAHDDISVSGKNFLAATLLDISEKERKEKKENKDNKEQKKTSLAVVPPTTRYHRCSAKSPHPFCTNWPIPCWCNTRAARKANKATTPPTRCCVPLWRPGPTAPPRH